MRNVSLFGHHHTAPTLGSRLADMAAGVAHLPREFWLAVIPIAGGLVIAYVTYLLNVRRDHFSLRRDAEQRRVDDLRVAARVYAELALQLNRHRAALRDAASGGAIARVESEHNALIRRAAQSDVIDALGECFLPFMSLLQHEEATLLRLSSHDAGSGLALDVDLTAELARIEASLDPYGALFAQPPRLRHEAR